MSFREPAVLHLTGMRSLKYGGVETYLRELASTSRHRGYRTVIQYEEPPHASEFVHDLGTAGCEVVAVSLGGGPWSALRRLVRLIRAVRPEIIHTHFVKGYVLLCLPFVGRMFGVRRLIAMPHGIHDPRSVWRRFAYARFDHVVGVSQAVSESLRRAGIPGERISTHYLGLIGNFDRSPDGAARLREQLGIPAHAPLLATIAFDAPVKGLDLLLQGFARAAEKLSDAHLMVVGVAPESSELPALARRLGIGGRVHWTGIHEQAWQLLSAADLYVQPSRSEAMPFAVMEAMALALPVLATRVGGLPELVADGETGWLAAPEADALAHTLECAFASRGRWPELGAAGRRRYQLHFDGYASARAFAARYYSACL